MPDATPAYDDLDFSSEPELEPSGDALGTSEPVGEASLLRRHATPLRVFFIGILLLGVRASFGFLAMPGKAPIALEDTESELFAQVHRPLPFGLQPDDSRRLPRGERTLSYLASGGEDASTDAAAPVSVTFIEYPASRAEDVLSDQFKKLRFESGDKKGGGGGRGGGGRGRSGGGGGSGRGGSSSSGGGGSKPKLRDAGFLDWYGYRANYARLRHGIADESDSAKGGQPKKSPRGDRATGADDAEPEKPFYETMRVNLSVGGRCVIGYLRFPEGVEGTKESMLRVIEAFAPEDD